MNYKRISGLIILIIGIALIAYALHSMKRISETKSDIGTYTKPFSKTPIGKAVEDTLMTKASEYDTQVRWLLIGGITLVVVGGIIIIFSRKRSKKG